MSAILLRPEPGQVSSPEGLAIISGPLRVVHQLNIHNPHQISCTTQDSRVFHKMLLSSSELLKDRESAVFGPTVPGTELHTVGAQ